MDTNTNQANKTPDTQKPLPRILLDAVIYFWIGFMVLSLLASNAAKNISYSEFLTQLQHGNIIDVVVTDNQIAGNMRDQHGKQQAFTTVRIDPQLAQKLEENHVKFSGLHTDPFWTSVLWWVLGALGIFTIMGFLSRKAGSSGSVFSPFAVEKNKARLYSEENVKITFADVAGVEEAEEELQEVVKFLKSPKEYSKLGGRLPKGILLVGPPGTGKTLLARAVAGETGVPFFSISGSEFVELFVGVGAARVRDLFSEARRKAPCIIFIDELDALGRSRSINPLMNHDEKEQTLNQLLVEMDGFDTSEGVVLLAATNRPEILDQALLRAGRFDRHVVVDRPDKKGRIDILRVHIKKVVVATDLDLEAIAALTPGFTGADLANVVNEAALLASRRKAEVVSQDDFEVAIERTIAGLEKKNRILTAAERQLVAHHEMGHALVAICLPGAETVQKVSIIPHGIAALGYTVQRPTEDRFILSRSELENKLAALLGGRAAELLCAGEASTGAADDLSKATDLARSMVTRYGMDPELGLATYEADGSAFLNLPAESLSQRGLGPETARQIDQAVKNLLDKAFQRATAVLEKNRSWLESAADKLLRDETLNREQIMALQPATVTAEIQSTVGMTRAAS